MRVSSGNNSANGTAFFREHLASNLSMSLTSGQEKTEVSATANDDRALSLMALSEGTMANDDLDFRGVRVGNSISLLVNADETFLSASVSLT